MNQEMPVLLTCTIGFRPKSEASRQRIVSIVAQSGRQAMATTAGYRFSGDNLVITGIGFDGRCSMCREIRLKAKNEGILFSSRCRYEHDDKYSWRVKIGASPYDITLLESEANYLRRKQEEPSNILVRTHLGAIAEARGQLSRALAEYLAVQRLCPGDVFTERRIQEVSARLLAQKKALYQSQSMIASSS